MLRSSTSTKTADMQDFRGVSCRGEDSNLCSVAEHDLTVGHPLHGSGLSPFYGLMVGLTLAAALGWPYVLLFAITVGPSLGAQHALSANKEKVASE